MFDELMTSIPWSDRAADREAVDRDPAPPGDREPVGRAGDGDGRVGRGGERDRAVEVPELTTVTCSA